ncbi:MAG TPA: nuclear transport factor 2 family protein [Pyrinomonadaceae bacterium]|nr:nuclear transport factor 2 family protein [Pyrinomonadaceae bacterium]
MKIRSLLLLLPVFCFLGGSTAAQKKTEVNDLRSMVETERAFARMSEEKGTREAFAAFIADEGILFRPTAVLGKKWMQENPLPPSTTRPLLAWQPIFAFVSSAGDLGYTTGPWQYKKDIKDAQPTAFGNFMTVWKKQADGSWKFALDLGVSNPEPKDPLTIWRPGQGQMDQEISAKVDQQLARSGLLDAERKFSQVSAELGARESFLLYAAKDVRLFRNDHSPFVGKMAAADALAPVTAEWTWTSLFAGVSISGDLGYTYGIYELREKAGIVSERGNYARVWKKVLGDWKLVIDVADPLPRK